MKDPKEKKTRTYEVWRKKLKKDLTMYEEYKRRDALNQRNARQRMTDEQQKIYNEKSRLRMQDYRRRKKTS